MRGRLALLGTTTALVLGAAVAVAAPSEARNIGGTQISQEACVTPHGARLNAPDVDLPCVCALALNPPVIRVVGKTATCPQGIVGR